MVVCADGVMKLSHYVNCGRTHSLACSEAGLTPAVDTYVSQSTIAAYNAAKAEATGEEPEDACVCQADLTCNRPTAVRAGAVTDIKCTAGIVCAHVVPGRGLFLPSSSPEHYLLYDVLLLQLLKDLAAHGRVLSCFILDINCRFASHFKRRLSPEQQLGVAALTFAVGWLHSKAGHNLQCQLAYNAMYLEDTGRVVGEQAEQLWVRCVCVCVCVCV